MLRDQKGYIDPIMSALPLALLVILFAGPWLVKAIHLETSSGLGSWLKLSLAGLVMVAIQAYTVAVTLTEAYHDAHSRGVRRGLNRAPSFQGWKAPVALAVLYVIGIWPLLRMEPRRAWAIAVYGLLAGTVLAAGFVANRMGRNRSATPKVQ